MQVELDELRQKVAELTARVEVLERKTLPRKEREKPEAPTHG
jgi:BMFP domain-containing protein YqiC